jgi:hypothetical protein
MEVVSVKTAATPPVLYKRDHTGPESLNCSLRYNAAACSSGSSQMFALATRILFQEYKQERYLHSDITDFLCFLKPDPVNEEQSSEFCQSQTLKTLYSKPGIEAMQNGKTSRVEFPNIDF